MIVEKQIDTYVADLPKWQSRLADKLRELIHEADPYIDEEWDWNHPNFVHGGTVCLITADRGCLNLTFYQGASINDKYKVFSAGDTNDRARTIQFRTQDSIPREAIADYVRQAVANNLAGIKFVPKHEPEREIVLSPFIRDTLVQAGLLQAFNERPYYQRSHWPQWVEAPKLESTRVNRLAIMMEELRNGGYMETRKMGRKQ